jgi:hypothetical protein
MRNFIVILENPFIEITELIVSAYVVPGNYPLESRSPQKRATEGTERFISVPLYIEVVML